MRSQQGCELVHECDHICKAHGRRYRCFLLDHEVKQRPTSDMLLGVNDCLTQVWGVGSHQGMRRSTARFVAWDLFPKH